MPRSNAYVTKTWWRWRAAVGQGVHDLEIGEGEDHREHRHDDEDRLDDGQGHVPEPLCRVAPSIAAAFVEIGRNGLQSGQERDAVEGDATPGVDDDDRHHGQVALPSQENPVLTAPVWTSTQLMMLNVGSKIHIQAIVLSTVGTMNGTAGRRARGCGRGTAGS
jgi:hypothetical protein